MNSTRPPGADSNHVQARWQTEQGRALRAETLRSLRALARPSQTDLRGIDLSHEVLPAAPLMRLALDDASFDGADLTAANLSGASLRRARFRGACLVGATLAYADARACDLRDARLAFCDLEDAEITCALRARRGHYVERAIRGGWPSFADVVPLYLQALRRPSRQVVRAVQAASDVSERWDAEVEVLVRAAGRGESWREQLIGAVAVSAVGAGASVLPALWAEIPRSWAAPQLVVAARLRDPAFRARAAHVLGQPSTRPKSQGALAWALDEPMPDDPDARLGGQLAARWDAELA